MIVSVQSTQKCSLHRSYCYDGVFSRPGGWTRCRARDDKGDHIIVSGREMIGNDVLRQVVAQKNAIDVKNVLIDQYPDASVLGEDDCLKILASCVSAENYELVLSIFASLFSPSEAAGSFDSENTFEWPRRRESLSAEVVKLLCRNLETKTALEILNIIRHRGVQSSEDIHFGFVVDCPDGRGRPLALMQPHEGSKVVPDSYSKYEYEIFSGRVVRSESESLVSTLSWWKQIGFQLGRMPTAALHTMTIEAPSGQQRTFKFGTPLSSAPAKVGDRVSLVCSPEQGKSSRQSMRYSGILTPSPPGTRPGEPLSITNHTVGGSTDLNRPVDTNDTLPGLKWLLPALVFFVGVDAASSIINPLYPMLFAGMVGSSALALSLGSNVVLPNLKKLPDSSLGLQETRQGLLQEHVRLTSNMQQLMVETVADVRMLARLWQLLGKMNSMEHHKAYTSRIERVIEAKDAMENRLEARISMIHEYAKVLSMIEIEVEMETDIPLAEYQGTICIITRAYICFLIQIHHGNLQISRENYPD